MHLGLYLIIYILFENYSHLVSRKGKTQYQQDLELYQQPKESHGVVFEWGRVAVTPARMKWQIEDFKKWNMHL